MFLRCFLVVEGSIQERSTPSLLTKERAGPSVKCNQLGEKLKSQTHSLGSSSAEYHKLCLIMVGTLICTLANEVNLDIKQLDINAHERMCR